MNILGTIFSNWGLHKHSDSQDENIWGFPLIRRVVATLIGHDLVAVQPMGLPAGMVFYSTIGSINTNSVPNKLGILPYPPMSNRWIKKPSLLDTTRRWGELVHPPLVLYEQ